MNYTDDDKRSTNEGFGMTTANTPPPDGDNPFSSGDGDEPNAMDYLLDRWRKGDAASALPLGAVMELRRQPQLAVQYYSLAAYATAIPKERRLQALSRAMNIAEGLGDTNSVKMLQMRRSLLALNRNELLDRYRHNEAERLAATAPTSADQTQFNRELSLLVAAEGYPGVAQKIASELRTANDVFGAIGHLQYAAQSTNLPLSERTAIARAAFRLAIHVPDGLRIMNAYLLIRDINPRALHTLSAPFARYFIERGQLEDAERLLDDEFAGRDRPSLILRAQLHGWRGDLEQMNRSFEAALRVVELRRKDDPLVQFGLAERPNVRITGANTRVGAQFKQPASPPVTITSTSSVNFLWAVHLIELGQYEAAFQKVRDQQRVGWESQWDTDIGRKLTEAGQIGLAERFFHRGIRNHAPSAHWFYAVALFTAGRTDEALEHLTLQRYIEWPEGMARNAVRVLSSAGLPDEVRAEIAYMETKDFPDAHFQKALVAVEAGEHAEGVAELALQHDAHPEYPLHRQAAALWARAGRFDLELDAVGHGVALGQHGLENLIVAAAHRAHNPVRAVQMFRYFINEQNRSDLNVTAAKLLEQLGSSAAIEYLNAATYNGDVDAANELLGLVTREERPSAFALAQEQANTVTSLIVAADVWEDQGRKDGVERCLTAALALCDENERRPIADRLQQYNDHFIMINSEAEAAASLARSGQPDEYLVAARAYRSIYLSDKAESMFRSAVASNVVCAPVEYSRYLVMQLRYLDAYDVISQNRHWDAQNAGEYSELELRCLQGMGDYVLLAEAHERAFRENHDSTLSKRLSPDYFSALLQLGQEAVILEAFGVEMPVGVASSAAARALDANSTSMDHDLRVKLRSRAELLREELLKHRGDVVRGALILAYEEAGAHSLAVALSGRLVGIDAIDAESAWQVLAQGQGGSDGRLIKVRSPTALADHAGAMASALETRDAWDDAVKFRLIEAQRLAGDSSVANRERAEAALERAGAIASLHQLPTRAIETTADEASTKFADCGDLYRAARTQELVSLILEPRSAVPHVARAMFHYAESDALPAGTNERQSPAERMQHRLNELRETIKRDEANVAPNIVGEERTSPQRTETTSQRPLPGDRFLEPESGEDRGATDDEGPPGGGARPKTDRTPPPGPGGGQRTREPDEPELRTSSERKSDGRVEAGPDSVEPPRASRRDETPDSDGGSRKDSSRSVAPNEAMSEVPSADLGNARSATEERSHLGEDPPAALIEPSSAQRYRPDRNPQERHQEPPRAVLDPGQSPAADRNRPDRNGFTGRES